MASGGEQLPPWDRGNVNEQELIDMSDYKEVLNQSRITLRNNLRLDDVWPHLHKMGVITQNDEDRMKLNTINCESVDRLIIFLNTCQTWSYHALLRAMALTQQGHLIPPGGLLPAVYMEDMQQATGSTPTKQHFYKKADSDIKLPISADLLPALLRHCEVSQEYLMKAPLFGFHEDITIDISELHIRTDVQYTHKKKMKTIGWKQLFNSLFQKPAPNTLLIEGETGSGKTTFLEDYTRRHCKEFTECEEKGPESPCLGHSWKLILYIPARSVTGSQEAAIRDNLHCDDKHKDQVMAMIKDDGECVLVINDGLDELRKEAERESLRQYTISHQKGGRPKVLNSARLDHCHIEGKFVDRKVTLNGFSIEQGLQYVETYFNETPETSTGYSVLLEYIKQQKEEIEWILTNPLRVHIFSHLAASGMLTPQDIRNITPAKLLNVLESFVLKRDEKCQAADTAEKHSANFYALCLECLLRNEKTIAEHRIPNLSPYKASLIKQKRINLFAEEERYYKFGHELFLEYYSMRGLCQYLKSDHSQSKAMLLGLCVNPNMRNTLQLLFGYISEYEPDLHEHLVFITQACLILQPEYIDIEEDDEIESEVDEGEGTKGYKEQHSKADPGQSTEGDDGQQTKEDKGQHTEQDEGHQECWDNMDVMKKLLELPALIKENFAPGIINAGLSGEQMVTMLNVAEQIEAAFNENAEHLKAVGWFLRAEPDGPIEYAQASELLQFITGSIRQCTPSLQEKISSRTTHKLIPTTLFDMEDSDICSGNMEIEQEDLCDGHVFPVSGLRWGLVYVYSDYTSIWFWCPADLAPILRQLYTQHTPPTGAHRVSIDLGYFTSLWGKQTPEMLTCDQWVAALHEVFTHRVNELHIYTDHLSGTIPIEGLISGLQKVITPSHSLTGGLSVECGHVSATKMKEFATWTSKVGLSVGMWYITVLLSEEQDESVARSVNEHVQNVMQPSFSATYKTHGGQTVHF